MKTPLASLRLRLPVIASFCLAFGLGACATQRVDWAARVGRYTYEQAQEELGKPEEQDKLTNGTVVAEWLIHRGYTRAESEPGPYGPFYPTYPKTYTAPSQYLRLTFGPDHQLTTWTKIYQ